MPPAGGGKRKRPDRTNSGDNAHRHSPHRPAELELAKQGQQSNFQPRTDGGRQARRSSRGGKPTSSESNAPTQSPNISIAPPAQPPSTTVSMTNGQDDGHNGHAETVDTFSCIFDFEHITDAVVQSWPDDGRDNVKSRLISLCQIEDIETLNTFMQEVVESATTGRIDAEDTGKLVKEGIAAIYSDDAEDGGLLQEALLSAVAVLFADEESDSRNSPIAHVAELALFLHATEINPETLRLEFESKLIEQLGLVRDSFYRQMVRKQTNLLYRQSNYNLLREETEGFSKLVTELFTTSGNEVPHNDVVEATVEKIKAMIGAFDLDVGRSLDVVLDVFGSVLVKQYRFFVKFLRASPWWPRTEHDAQHNSAILRLGGLPQWALPHSEEWQLTDEQRKEFFRVSEQRDQEFWPLAKQQGLKAFFQLGNNQAATGPDDSFGLPRAGSYEASQLLGFKLRFYAPGAEGDSADGTPKNLIYLAALLIKIGFISLHDLYPHLWRPDAEMDAYREHKQQEKASQEAALLPGAGARNALTMAGALSDDTLSLPLKAKDHSTGSNTPLREAPSEKSNVKESNLDKPDQKLSLLLSLLAIGALPEALFILGKFPWMTELIPEVSEHVNRILHHALSRVYERCRPLRGRTSLTAQLPVLETETVGGQKGQKILTEAQPRRTLRWPLLDRDDSETDGISYRYYWDEWTDNVPVCIDVDDIFVLLETLIPLIGPKIGQDPSLVLKLVRIGKASLGQDDSVQNRERWLDTIKRLLLPALSLSKPNPGLANEMFELLNIYPIYTRYSVYAHWFAPLAKRSGPERRKAPKALLQAEKETSDVLKRISKSNPKPMARLLAKIAYSNPHVVAEHALRQIESYDAIADCFVEGARYFTDLGYDVLSWALIRAMSSVQRTNNRTQDDGIFIVKWLVALSRFAGKIYKRYHLMKPGPILQFVSKQIDRGETADLTTLEQMIVSMAGITPDTSFNDAQLLAMGGGPLLQSQTVLQLLDQRHTSKATAKRLVKALQEYGLTTKLLLSAARLRQSCIFDKDDIPLKAIGNTYDEVTRVLNLYFDLLKTNLSAEELHNAVPDVAKMMNDYDIPAEIAFWISRPIVQKQLADFDTEDLDIKDTNGDVDMLDQNASEEDGEAIEDNDDTMTTALTPSADEIVENVDGVISDTDDLPDIWHPVLKQVMNNIQGQLPSEVVDQIGVGFYVTFWQLSTYEISIPGKSYEEEMNRQKKKIAAITSDRSNVSLSGSKARDTQLKQLKQLVDDLLSENKQHIKAYSESRTRLQKEKDRWFAGKARQLTELNAALMEYCFLPRILLSTQDAYYCFKLVKMLHAFGTPNFRTIGFYDLLFKTERLTALIFQCTSKESDNLGKFLYEVLKDFDKWRQAKSTFEKEAYGSKRQLLGFAKKVEKGKPHVLFDFDDFKKILFKWHSNLHAAVLKCLGSPEYMHVRNAISILRAIAPVWPSVDYHGRQLKTAVDKLRESEREDLKVPSQAISGALHRRQRDWVSPSVFRPGPAPEGQPDQTTGSSTPQVKQESQTAVKQEKPSERDHTPDVKMEDTSLQVNGEKQDPQVPKQVEKVASSAVDADRKSHSRASTPLPARPAQDSSSRRPARPDGRAHDLPRRVSPPPRLQPPPVISGRLEPDSRGAYREHRPIRTSAAAELPPIDGRSNYPRPPADRSHEPLPEPSHRYPRLSDRLPVMEREERPPRRDVDPRSSYDDRRYNERDARPERDPRSDREIRPERDSRHDREHARPSERDYPRPGDRDYGRPPPEHPDRRREERREELHPPSRRDPAATSSRTTTPQAQAPPINPERAALIQGSEESRPGMSIRGQATERARTSRPTSPRRDEERKHAPRSDREDRPDRRTEGPNRASSALPSSPANTRSGLTAGPPRESRAPQTRPAVDMSHGRLEQETSHRPAARPDRNADAEPPSGPRTRGPNPAARNAETTPQTRAPPQARQPPSGPGRHSRNSSMQEAPLSVAPSSNDVGAVHPDRMVHISPVEQSRTHRPPPIQASPPSGPRNGPPTGPSAPSPNTRGPPSGPQAEGGGRGRRHPMATVNNTLAQAAQGGGGNGQPVPAGRGRGGPRQNSISYPNQMPPPSPVGGQNPSFPPQQDLMSNSNPNGMPIQSRGGPPSRQDDDRRSNRPHSSHQQGQRDGGSGRGDRNGHQQQQQQQQNMPDDGGNRRDSRGPPQPTRNNNIEDGQQPSNNRPSRGGGGYRGQNNPNNDDPQTQSRKHPRDENSQGQYGGGGMGRGGSRMANDSKRPRRGG